MFLTDIDDVRAAMRKELHRFFWWAAVRVVLIATIGWWYVKITAPLSVSNFWVFLPLALFAAWTAVTVTFGTYFIYRRIKNGIPAPKTAETSFRTTTPPSGNGERVSRPRNS